MQDSKQHVSESCAATCPDNLTDRYVAQEMRTVRRHAGFNKDGIIMSRERLGLDVKWGFQEFPYYQMRIKTEFFKD